MPQGQGIMVACFCNKGCESVWIFGRFEFRQFRLQLSRGIREIGRAGAFAGTSHARCARWYERFEIVKLERDPAGLDRDQPGSVLRDLKSIPAAEIDRGCRRSFDHETAWRRPDKSMDCAVSQIEVLLTAVGRDQP